MSRNFDITSANAAAILIVEEIFPAGITLQMFGTDQAVDMGAIEIAETRKGVDGRMVAGYTPVIYPVTVTLEAASPSYASLALLLEATTRNKKPYRCNLVVTVPSISVVLVWSGGTMKSGTPAPPLHKTLEPTTWVFDFEDFERSQV